MLVLSRHRDESIIIADNIVITVVDIRGDKVRLGIEAPSNVSVHRQEVYEAIQIENRKEALRREEETKARSSGGGGRQLPGDRPPPVGEGMGEAAESGKEVVQETSLPKEDAGRSGG